MKHIGYIGLGIMGRPMAANLMKAGFEVTVWNRTAGKAESLLEAGAHWADSPAALAAKVEAVCINVTDTPDVEQVIFGKQGIVEGNPGDTAGMAVIDHSTISPDATRRFAERLREQEISLLDAPVSGGDTGAQAGTLSVMVGGEREVFDRCRPVFDAVGKTITYCGPSGAGQATKACNQILCAVNLLGTCEALALAQKEGLDLKTTVEVTAAGAGGSWQLANLGPKIADRDFDPGFMIDLINKDLAIVAEAVRRGQLATPAAELAAGLFRGAAANGHGRDGTQAIAAMLEQIANFRYGES
jgi:3-hydroxyisobutyrate dehydrogenase